MMEISAALLAAGGGFDPSGILVLFGGIGAACLLYLARQNKANFSPQKTENVKSPETEKQGIQMNSSGGMPVSAKLQQEVQLTGVDEKTAAMLIAIVCEACGEDPRTLRFVSITAQNTEKG